eukprot:2352663-Amphidinium_carterae.1
MDAYELRRTCFKTSPTKLGHEVAEVIKARMSTWKKAEQLEAKSHTRNGGRTNEPCTRYGQQAVYSKRACDI